LLIGDHGSDAAGCAVLLSRLSLTIDPPCASLADPVRVSRVLIGEISGGTERALDDDEIAE